MSTATRPRVLCVDDDPQLLRSLRWLLQRDHDVTLAGSGEQALQALLQQRFDVIISDQRMPGMTGTEFLRKARDMAPHTARVLLTGYADFPAVMSSVNDSEVFRLIYKPWNTDRLLATVAEAVEASRAGLLADTDVMAPMPDLARKPVTDTVLVFDRDPEAVARIEVAARGLARVASTDDIGEALGMLSSGRAGILITDVALSALPQLDLIRSVRRHRPALVVLVHSALRDSAVLGQLINEGQIFRYVSKQTGPVQLRRILGLALKRYSDLSAHPERTALGDTWDGQHTLDFPLDPLPDDTDLRAAPGEPRGRHWLQRLFG